MPNTYTMGKLIRLSASFTDPTNNDAPVDPTVVTVKIRNPAGAIAVSALATRDSVGQYHYDYEIPSSKASAGTWAYRFECSGGGPTAAGDAYFVVPPDPFYGS